MLIVFSYPYRLNVNAGRCIYYLPLFSVCQLLSNKDLEWFGDSRQKLESIVNLVRARSLLDNHQPQKALDLLQDQVFIWNIYLNLDIKAISWVVKVSQLHSAIWKKSSLLPLFTSLPLYLFSLLLFGPIMIYVCTDN